MVVIALFKKHNVAQSSLAQVFQPLVLDEELAPEEE